MDMSSENSDNSTASAALPICPTMANPCALSGCKPKYMTNALLKI